MKSVKDVPFRFPSGPVSWEALGAVLGAWQRDILDTFDVRNPQAFPDGIVADFDGVTLGEAARVTSQRTLPPVNTGSKLSAQDAPPLESSYADGSASITVLPHSVQFGFGSVAYSGGTISGLDEDTDYYVYTDDARYGGGAVSYVATTNALEVVSANERYFVGQIKSATDGNPTTGGGGGGWDWYGSGIIP